MATSKETGFYQNTVAFKTLTSMSVETGDKYQPASASLAIPALQVICEKADASIIACDEALSLYDRSTNQRELLFDPLSPFITRVMNSLASTDVPQQTIDDAKFLADKIRGHNVNSSKAKNKEAMEGEEEPKSISTSQQSFDNKVKNVNALVMLLSKEPEYKPNEEDLKIESLRTLGAQLKAINEKVATDELLLDNARTERNKVIHAETTGLTKVGKRAKKYLMSLYTANSPEYKKISKITFTDKKI